MEYWRCRRWGAAAALAAVLAVTALPPAAAQATDAGSERAINLDRGFRIYVGMWSTHLRDIGRGLRQNWLVAAGWRGWYGGTFINSFGDRSFVAGIERTVARGSGGPVIPGVGYRLGIVTGYDERFIGIAGRVPALPMAQVTGEVAVGPTAVEVGWAGLVASLVPSLGM
jgi:hypothetical protein